MAFANSSVSDIIATTIQSRSGELADNVTNNNPLLLKLKSKGNVAQFLQLNLALLNTLQQLLFLVLKCYKTLVRKQSLTY